MTMIDSAPGESTQPRRVLLVDDSVDAAEAMSMLLETLGHEVRVMHDGPSALELLHQRLMTVMRLNTPTQQMQLPTMRTACVIVSLYESVSPVFRTNLSVPPHFMFGYSMNPAPVPSKITVTE